ncbi:MAG: pseudaminic acid synthase [Bacteroidota bacterium]|jgi:sialic acid synthase SpsE
MTHQLNQISPFIIAEISGNHNGDIEQCKKLILDAQSAGANAVKLQAFLPNRITVQSNKKDFNIDSKSPWNSHQTLFELYKVAQTPPIWFPELYSFAKNHNVTLMSSVFDLESLSLLQKLENPIYKIASPEINHYPLIREVAKTHKPIILSLGVASSLDLETAVSTIREENDSELVIMQCDTSYPAKINNANLKLLKIISTKYDVRIGYSDHTKSHTSALVSIGLGADVFEKHIKLQNDKSSVDSFFSLTPSEFKDYCDQLRTGYFALGQEIFRRTDESSSISIYPFKNIKKGDIFDEKNIQICRPGFSLHPRFWNLINGSKATRDLESGQRLSETDFEK